MILLEIIISWNIYNQNYIETKNNKWIKNNDIIQYLTIYIIIKKYMDDIYYIKTSRNNNNKIRS